MGNTRKFILGVVGSTICIFNKFLGHVDTAGLGTTLGETFIRIISYQEQNRHMRAIDVSEAGTTLKKG